MTTIVKKNIFNTRSTDAFLCTSFYEKDEVFYHKIKLIKLKKYKDNDKFKS